MKKLAIFVCIVISSIYLMGKKSFYDKDDISIFAAEMIDSLRMRPDEIFESKRPQCWSDSAKAHLNLLDFPSVQDYLDDADEIPKDTIATFEKDFYLRYVLFDLLLPPYYKTNNTQDRLPIFSLLKLPENTERSYIDSITGIEIGILPQIQGDKLKLELFVQQVYWDRIEQRYTRPIWFWIADGTEFAEDYLEDTWLYQYHEGIGWERKQNVELDSVGVNDIVRLCVESAKISADVINSGKNINRIFIDHKYILQYPVCDEGYRILSDPDYKPSIQEYVLEYFTPSYDPAIPFAYEGEYLDDIKAGAYFLRPKYRLDGNRFYVVVEVYFAKVDDDKHLTYDLRYTDNYTYQLDSDNQWQLLK